MQKKLHVLLLRRNELDSPERTALEAAFPDRMLEYLRIDPRDYLEHERICAEFSPDEVIVFLPRERPIPSLAMEKGYRHVALTPEGLGELEPLAPAFKPVTR